MRVLSISWLGNQKNASLIFFFSLSLLRTHSNKIFFFLFSRCRKKKSWWLMGWNGDVFSNSSLPFIFHLREPCCINQLHTRQQQRSTRLTRTRMCVIHLALPESNFPFLKNRLWIFLISNFRAIHFLRQVDRENSPPPLHSRRTSSQNGPGMIGFLRYANTTPSGGLILIGPDVVVFYFWCKEEKRWFLIDEISWNKTRIRSVR